MTLKELQQSFNDGLQDHFQSTEVNAFFFRLAEAYLGYTRFDVSLQKQEEVSATAQQKFLRALKRLQHHEPIQYIIGHTEFYGLRLAVNPHVLIPRPETEELVELVLNHHQHQPSLRVLDVCTGSGCIGIALAKHLKNAQVTGVDISTEALAIARKNAKENDLNLTFIAQDILTQPFDLFVDVIVSNPPYVRNLEKENMEDNVLNHEPHLALFVPNEDPLLFYRSLAQISKQTLTPNGKVYCEINEYLGRETKALFEAQGFKNVQVKKDIFGKDRMLVASC